jgi:polysaccharide deacetylase family protein (PEP-CTERM system associated)
MGASNEAASPRPAVAFTVDVEDWYQSCIDYDAPVTERVLRNVDRILSLLGEHGVKGTFFVQGMVAVAFPQLVETILAEGHEIQSHGYSHRPLSRMNERELDEELRRSKAAIEDAAGFTPTAFRAQDFSIVRENLWALDAVAEHGFSIDSSIFPISMARYGIDGVELGPHHVQLRSGGTILEVPVAVREVGRFRIPVAGGGYFRLLPAVVLRRALAGIVAAGRPAIVYCHPYEFNPRELDEYRHTAPAKFRLQQGLGRRAFASRFRRLLSALPFGRFDDVLSAYGFAPHAAAPGAR